MATEKLRAELELITKNAEKDLARLDRSLAGVEKRVKSIGGRGGRSLKPLGDGLSAATANASEFEKSMAAANARVIAFGASAGLIFQVQKALKETVRATVEVEKALTDINVVLGAGAKDLEKFGNRLFKVAAQTGQSFKTIATGATELARQGLGTEKTLKRLSDAMILSRLTGMGAEEAVSSLTAAVNSFNKAGITSAQVVNKMAKVDQAFAVSSDDLAKAISRVGSSAVDAGVSMDELLAITTAVQQRTARGGAVIGNAFKTIFTRIGRTDVQKKLTDIGVATRDMATGAMLPATKVLENLSQKFQTLSQVQQNQIAESVAGVFQVNILRAALGDLSSKYGVYTRAIKESSTATDEAYQKNAQLNQTLDALVNKTLANLTKAGASIGGATLKPAIENVLGFVNSAIEAFGEGGRFEKFGQGIGKDILSGLGSFIAGPGLAIITYGIGRLLVNFGGFAKQALGGILELNKNVALRKNIEASVTAELSRQPAIIKQIQRGELSAAAAAKDMLAAMRASNVEATKLAVTSRAIASSMMGVPGGMRGMRGTRGAGRADGFVPNFANPNAERAAASAGGYKAGGIRTMSIPGQGAVMYNSAETVKQFPGMKQPAIMPPQGSLAGSNYQKAFGAAHGFDPYAAGGFVPNFNIGAALGATTATRNMTLDQAIKAGLTRQQLAPAFGKEAVDAKLGAVSKGGKPVRKTKKLKPLVFDARHQLGILGLDGLSGDKISTSTAAGNISQFKRAGLTERQLQTPIRFENISVRNLNNIRRTKGGQFKQQFSNEVSQQMLTPVSKIAKFIYDKGLGNDFNVSVERLRQDFRGQTQLLPTSAEGQIFEAAINLGLLTNRKSNKATFDQSLEASTKPFDFEEAGTAKPPFKEIFDFRDTLLYADAKRTADTNQVRTLIKKAYNRGVPGLPQPSMLKGGKAAGLIPNFSPLGDAVTRERAAGVPASAIRVGSSPALKGPSNPGGLGVYNTIHEPAGLGQGISRSRRMGINPKSHGVPNFADGFGLDKRLKDLLDEVKTAGPGPMFPGGRPVDPRLAPSAGSLTTAFADERARVLTEEIADLAKETRRNKDEIKKANKAYADSIRGKRRGGFGAGFGENLGMMAGGASMIGYMMAPAVAEKTGLDVRGLEGGFGLGGLALAGAGTLKGGLMGLGLLGPIGATIAAGGAVGLAAYGGYQMFKTDEGEKEFEAELERIGMMKEDQQKMSATLSAMTSGVASLMQTEGLTLDQKKARVRQLQNLRDVAVSAGSAVGVDSSTIDKIYEDAFRGDMSGAELQQKAIAESVASATREEAMAHINETTRKANQALEEDFQALKLAKMFDRGEFLTDGQREFMMMRARKGTGAVRVDPETGGFASVPMAERMEDVLLGNMLKEGSREGGFLDLQSKALFELGAKGETSRRNLLRGQLEKQFGGKEGATDFISSASADELLDAVDKAAFALTRSGELHEDYYDSLFGDNAIEGLARLVVSTNRYTFEREQFSEAEEEFFNKKAKVYADQTDLNKKFIGQLLDDSLNMIKAKQAIQTSMQIDLGKIANDRKLMAARNQSAVTMAQIRGGEMAGLDFAIGNVRQNQEGLLRKDISASLRRSQGIFERSKQGGLTSALARVSSAAKFGTGQFQAFGRQELVPRMVLNEEGFLTSDGTMIPDPAKNVTRTLQLQKAESELNLIKEFKPVADPTKDPAAASEEFQKFLKERITQLASLTQIGGQEENAIRDYVKHLESLTTEEATEAGTRKRLNALLESAITTEEELLRLKKKEAEARKRFQPDAYIQGLRNEQLMASTTVSGLETLQNRGFGITGAQKAAAAGRLRRSNIAMGEGFQGLGGMRDAFSYNANDAAFEFDAAMVDFGQTIKDSTKGAVKDIISGAESFEDAMYNVFATLADKIANQGINQGVDSIFGSLFGRRHGGKIPGYNQGGVVTGGSGVRDDVLTMMQGGEYVIKKSSAQKIGYGTLNAINGYANGGKARVSLAKEFLFTGDDPRRPTGGRYNVSRNLSTAAIFREDDPQTSRMFGRQETMVNYQEYRRAEQARRDKILDGIKRQKRARLMNAYISAGLRIGAGFLPNIGGSGTAAVEGGTGSGALTVNPAKAGSSVPEFPMARGGSPALLMGGEYVMSPRTTAKYGTGFMAELNRGKVPGYAQGGMVGGGGTIGSGLTTNNVNLSINIDKSGDTQVETQESSSIGQDKESQEVENSKKFADAIRAAVQKEITHQQRPGGLLRDGASYAGGRRI